ncbi:MAG: hypothetical protein QXI02_04030, partial [Candidatus Caldarchaeum sp.]
MLLFLSSTLLGRVLYVDPSVEYDLIAVCDANNIPRPSAYWKLADGVDYDTTGTGYYRNYGDSVLASNLVDVNRPLLTEGVNSKGQSALAFVRSSDHRLNIVDPNTLNISTESF